MLAVSCNSAAGTIKMAFIFKLDDVMVLMTHNINYLTQEWSREISENGTELLYDGLWNYETAD